MTGKVFRIAAVAALLAFSGCGVEGPPDIPPAPGTSSQ